MLATNSLYDLPAAQIDYRAVRDFLLAAEQADLLTESTTLELKQKRSGNNVAEAVAALSNTDGGLVLVGVSEEETGEARFKGISQRDFEGLMAHLRDLVPRALPEAIPVRIPYTDKLVAVLRIDADAVLHPVLVKGTTLYRIPGHNVPADRQRVLDLVARDQTGLVGTQIPAGAIRFPPPLAGSASDFPLWPDEHTTLVTVRFKGEVLLPQRILERPWLGSVAKEAALDALNRSPIPDKVWGMAPPPQQLQSSAWQITEARATSFKMRAPLQGTVKSASEMPASASAFLSLAGRTLSIILGMRCYLKQHEVIPLGLQDLYQCVLAELLSISSACDAVSTAIGAAEPSELQAWEGWLQPQSDLRVPSVLNINDYPRDGTEQPIGGWFPPARPRGRSVADLDAMARDWITVLLLEMGLRDFEKWLSSIALPEWAQHMRFQ
ncbi:ATP-binding protein [Streptosporangium sp. NPDC023963]|uniref:AlbA family DNA-binding domain-containing protein n=1 Tax=Streptosporangium sp. NPDC023963 TaxID=3155608 RepID=UPI00341DCEFA